jgi:hypothetical protein
LVEDLPKPFALRRENLHALVVLNVNGTVGGGETTVQTEAMKLGADIRTGTVVWATSASDEEQRGNESTSAINHAFPP